jgi:hypothetical protein
MNRTGGHQYAGTGLDRNELLRVRRAGNYYGLIGAGWLGPKDEMARASHPHLREQFRIFPPTEIIGNPIQTATLLHVLTRRLSLGEILRAVEVFL